MDLLTILIIKGWLIYCADKYHVDRAFAYGVCTVESRKGNEEFRTGKHGKYWLPMGIHDDFRKLRGWPVDDLFFNIEAGVRALRGGPQDRVLRRYNTEWSGSYAQAVKQAQNNYRREK